MQSIDPTTGQAYRRWIAHDEAEVDRRLHAAVEAQRTWQQRTFEERAAVLVAIADRIEAELHEHAPAMTREMGKPIAESEGELRKCAWVCRHYAEHAGSMLAGEPADLDDDEALVCFDPLGVVLAVMPWNFPWWQVLRFAAPALMAGNAMLVKHAPNTQGCAEALEALCLRAGLPEGLLSRLVVEVGAVEELIADRRVAAVTLTGSDRAGRAVGALAGRHLKKAVLELGGSDPFIVLSDADLEAAVAEGVRSRTLNNGQSCIAAKRFLVERAVYPEFRDRFVAALEALVVGDPADPATDIGPLARADLRDGLEAQRQQALSEGAGCLLFGGPLDRPGFFFAPCVLEDPHGRTIAMHEETFGPLAALRPVHDAAQAVAIANGSRFGLGASVWTRDRARAEQLARSLHAGCVFVNRMTASDPRVPFGGVKDSGYGRELGLFGIREFVNVKTVVLRGF